MCRIFQAALGQFAGRFEVEDLVVHMRGIVPPGMTTLSAELTAKTTRQSAGQDAQLYGRLEACGYVKHRQNISSDAWHLGEAHFRPSNGVFQELWKCVSGSTTA
jgi:hypothetical protein